MPEMRTGPTADGNQQRGSVLKRWMALAIIFLILAFLFFFSQFLNLDLFNSTASGFTSLPVSIRAGSAADYSRDPHGVLIPPISENILNQIITDFPSTGSPQDRAARLQADLLNPVPSMTPDRRLTAFFTQTYPSAKPTRPGYSPTPSGVTPQPTATGLIPLTPTPLLTYWKPTLSISTSTPTLATPTYTPTFQPPTPTYTPTFQPPTLTYAPTSQPPINTLIPPEKTKKPKPTKKPK